MSQSNFKVKLAGTEFRVTHYHSDGEVSVFNERGKCLESISHEEHENAVCTFEAIKSVLTALEAEGI
jgi:hypothetical protein